MVATKFVALSNTCSVDQSGNSSVTIRTVSRKCLCPSSTTACCIVVREVSTVTCGGDVTAVTRGTTELADVVDVDAEGAVPDSHVGDVADVEVVTAARKPDPVEVEGFEDAVVITAERDEGVEALLTLAIFSSTLSLPIVYKR